MNFAGFALVPHGTGGPDPGVRPSCHLDPWGYYGGADEPRSYQDSLALPWVSPGAFLNV